MNLLELDLEKAKTFELRCAVLENYTNHFPVLNSEERNAHLGNISIKPNSKAYKWRLNIQEMAYSLWNKEIDFVSEVIVEALEEIYLMEEVVSIQRVVNAADGGLLTLKCLKEFVVVPHWNLL